MAVFTKLKKNEIEIFLKKYSIGNLISYEGIVEGIENTNYKVITSNNIYILTIFEKRVNPKELPFFMDLQIDLANHNFDCPLPIKDNSGSIINIIKGKSAVMTSFLAGKQLNSILPIHCREVGLIIAKLTNITKSFNLKRKNSLNLQTCENIYKKCKDKNEKSYKTYFEILGHELSFLKKNWPNNLPKAIIHADLFKDNIFFIKNKISGVIDFYFSCEDFVAYELALAINAWCFNPKGELKYKNYLFLMEGFNKYSSLNKDEKRALNILLRGAAVRILVTRLHDKIYHPKDAMVVPKNPSEYLRILEWHQKNNEIGL